MAWQAAKAAVVDFYETLRYEVKDDVGVTVATHGWVVGDAGGGSRCACRDGKEWVPKAIEVGKEWVLAASQLALLTGDCSRLSQCFPTFTYL